MTSRWLVATSTHATHPRQLQAAAQCADSAYPYEGEKNEVFPALAPILPVLAYSRMRVGEVHRSTKSFQTPCSHMTPRNNQTRVRITALEFAETFGISKKKAYEELKEATDELIERKITEVNGKVTDKMRWVSRATYHSGEGWAEVTLAPEVMPMLTLLREKFTSYRLKRVAGLRSIYSIRLFELCAQFSKTGLLRIDLDEFIREIGTLDDADLRRCAPARPSRVGPGAQGLQRRMRVWDVGLQHDAGGQVLELVAVQHAHERLDAHLEVAVLLHVKVHERLR